MATVYRWRHVARKGMKSIRTYTRFRWHYIQSLRQLVVIRSPSPQWKGYRTKSAPSRLDCRFACTLPCHLIW